MSKSDTIISFHSFRGNHVGSFIKFYSFWQQTFKVQAGSGAISIFSVVVHARLEYIFLFSFCQTKTGSSLSKEVVVSAG